MGYQTAAGHRFQAGLSYLFGKKTTKAAALVSEDITLRHTSSEAGLSILTHGTEAVVYACNQVWICLQTAYLLLLRLITMP